MATRSVNKADHVRLANASGFPGPAVHVVSWSAEVTVCFLLLMKMDHTLSHRRGDKPQGASTNKRRTGFAPMVTRTVNKADHVRLANASGSEALQSGRLKLGAQKARAGLFYNLGIGWIGENRVCDVFSF